MKEETKRQFDEVFAQHSRKIEQQREAKVALETSEEQFLLAFRERCASTIQPALERIREYLGTKGMSARISQSEERKSQGGRVEAEEQISIHLIMPGEVANRLNREQPNFALQADKHKREIILFQSTLAPGRSGASGSIGGVPLEQITEEFLQDKVLGLVREVLK